MNILEDIRSAAGLTESKRKRRFGDLQRDASNVAALQTKLAQLKSKTGVDTSSRAFKAGVATAKVDMRRGGAKLAVQVPQKSDNKDWRDGYLSALPLEVAIQARRRLGESTELEEAKARRYTGDLQAAYSRLKRHAHMPPLVIQKYGGKLSGAPMFGLQDKQGEWVSDGRTKVLFNDRKDAERFHVRANSLAMQAYAPRESTELEESKGADFGEKLKEKLKGTGSWKYQDTAGPMSYALKCDDVGNKGDEVRRKVKRFLLSQGFKLAKTTGKPDGFEWGEPYRQIYKRDRDEVSIESSTPFKGIRIIYSRNTQLRGPEGPGKPRAPRREFTGQGALFGESRPLVEPDVAFAMALAKAIKRYGRFKVEPGKGGQGMVLSKDEVGRPHECRKAIIDWLKRKGFTEAAFKPGGWEHRNRWIYRKGNAQVEIAHQAIYDSMTVTISPGAGGSEARRPDPIQTGMFGESTTNRLERLLEAVKLHLPSGAAHQIKTNPLEYITTAAMDAQVDLRGADSLADLLGRMDPPPPRAAMIDARNAAELVGKARAGAWRAKGLLKDLVRQLQSRPSARAMALEDSE